MKHKADVLKEIDAAIDAMDNSKINNGLQALAKLEPDAIQAEDAKLFAARIQNLNKERITMKKFLKRMPLVAASAVLLMGITAYAAGVFNRFTFQIADKIVTVQTTEDMTEEEAKELWAGSNAAELPAEAAAQESADNEAAQVQSEDFAFDSVEQAEETMDMVIPLPSALPDMKLDSVNGSAYAWSEEYQKRTVWLNFSDENGRLFGVTETRSVIKPGSDVTSYSTNDIDEGSLGKYASKSGLEYTTLTESDDTGTFAAHIAMVSVGEYEYVLVFAGFNEDERQEIIDSADLTALR